MKDYFLLSHHTRSCLNRRNRERKLNFPVDFLRKNATVRRAVRLRVSDERRADFRPWTSRGDFLVPTEDAAANRVPDAAITVLGRGRRSFHRTITPITILFGHRDCAGPEWLMLAARRFGFHRTPPYSNSCATTRMVRCFIHKAPGRSSRFHDAVQDQLFEARTV